MGIDCLQTHVVLSWEVSTPRLLEQIGIRGYHPRPKGSED